MKSSRTDKDLSMMVNSARRPSRRRERQSIHDTSIQALLSLMEFLGKGIQQYSSITTRINAVRI